MIAEFLRIWLPEILQVLLCALFAFLGMGLKALAERFLDDQTKRDLAKTVVHFVEQVYRELHGGEKLEKACDLLASRLAGKGISLTGEELVLLIESAVGEMNQALGKNR